MKRQNGHFWLPLARHIETSVNPLMVAPLKVRQREQDVDEKTDEELPVEERPARAVRKPGEPRSAQPMRELGRSRGHTVLEGRCRQVGSVPQRSACGLGSRIRNLGA